MIGNPPEYRKCTKEGHSNCKLKRLCLEKNCSSELICSECALDYHTSHAYNCKPID